LVSKTKQSKTQQHYVIEYVVRGRRHPEEVKKQFERFVSPENITEVKVSGSSGRVVLNRQGYADVRKASRDRNLTIKQFATLLTSQHDV